MEDFLIEMSACPFCGQSNFHGVQLLFVTSFSAGRFRQVICEVCGCRGPELGEDATDQECVDIWNKRL